MRGVPERNCASGDLGRFRAPAVQQSVRGAKLVTGEDEESGPKQWSAVRASYDFLVAELEQFGSQEAEGGEDEDMTATQAGLEEAWSSSQISLFNGL